MILHDREHAALLLAEKLKGFKDTNSIVLAIPRGGVPVGYHIAHFLNLPMEILLCKKIGHPMNSEYAIGSVSLDALVLDDRRSTGVSQDYIDRKTDQIKKQLQEKYRLFMGDRLPSKLHDKTVILVDDGLATGNTMLACVKGVRKQRPKKIVVAVPVASSSSRRLLFPEVDQFVAVAVPEYFQAVGQFYDNFDEVSDDDVKKLMTEVAEWRHETTI